MLDFQKKELKNCLFPFDNGLEKTCLIKVRKPKAIYIDEFFAIKLTLY